MCVEAPCSSLPQMDVKSGQGVDCETGLSTEKESRRTAKNVDTDLKNTTSQFCFCFVGLQVSYLTWGYAQEKVIDTGVATSALDSAVF